MFKRILLACAAISLLAVPAAQANARHGNWGQDRQITEAGYSGHHRDRRPVYKKKGQRGHVERRGPQREHWRDGRRAPSWQRGSHWDQPRPRVQREPSWRRSPPPTRYYYRFDYWYW